MDVLDEIRTSNEHSIEWGKATWNKKTSSIRNRYDNAKGGKFNYAGSAEVPWEDFKTMITESIKRNHFTKSELEDFLNKFSNKLSSSEGI